MRTVLNLGSLLLKLAITVLLIFGILSTNVNSVDIYTDDTVTAPYKVRIDIQTKDAVSTPSEVEVEKSK